MPSVVGALLLSISVWQALSSGVCQQRSVKNDFLGNDGSAGYIVTNASRGHCLWYWVFESQGNVETDPVILWMQGGPGASGSLALFYENGPFHVNDSLDLTANANSWTTAATSIYIDQPIGTGWAFSEYAVDELNVREGQMMDEVLSFLSQFMKLFPQYATQDFYVFGESYAGHYIPVVCTKIMEYNQAGGSPRINLQGAGIGDGWVDPIIQYQGYIDFAVMNNLIKPGLAGLLEEDYEVCAKAINESDWVIAAASCNLIVAGIFAVNPGMNFYDIRVICPTPLDHDCYNFTDATRFMSQLAVREQIGVSFNRVWQDPEDPFAVLAAVNGDEEMSFASLVSGLLNSGLRMLIYSGQYDFAANYVGGEAWLAALPWVGQMGFNSAQLEPWLVNGTSAGLAKSFKNLDYVRVANAGHMVPMNQPVNALAMLNTFLADAPFAP